MLARNSLAKASSLKKLAPVSTRAFSSGEFFPGIPKIQVRGGYFVPSPVHLQQQAAPLGRTGEGLGLTRCGRCTV
jgi:hypothetical protein